VQYRILGPLQVIADDGEVRVGSSKERTLLAVLLLQASSVVSRERLIDELWGESPPPTAARALNTHVSQLRKTLARGGRDPIATARAATRSRSIPAISTPPSSSSSWQRRASA
jgi:DNA-binding SARP family transcriptional activator